MVRLYLLPYVWLTPPDVDYDGRYPKYVKGYTDISYHCLSWEFAAAEGENGHCLLKLDATEAQHTTLAAETDVSQFPLDIDVALSPGAVTVYQNKLEAVNLPAGWVNTSYTHREALTLFNGFISFLQRYAGIGAKTGNHAIKLFSGAVDLDTEYRNLPTSAQDGLVATADDFGLDKSSIGPTSKLRTIIKAVGVQMETQPAYVQFISTYPVQ